jgi:hypothetical protein
MSLKVLHEVIYTFSLSQNKSVKKYCELQHVSTKYVVIVIIVNVKCDQYLYIYYNRVKLSSSIFLNT